jgi:hypothetical protein
MKCIPPRCRRRTEKGVSRFWPACSAGVMAAEGFSAAATASQMEAVPRLSPIQPP